MEIGSVIQKAWHNVANSKWEVCSRILSIMIIGAALSLIFFGIAHAFMPTLKTNQIVQLLYISNLTRASFFKAFLSILFVFVVGPILLKVLKLAINKSRGEPTDKSTIGCYQNKWWSVFIALFVTSIGISSVSSLLVYLVATFVIVLHHQPNPHLLSITFSVCNFVGAALFSLTLLAMADKKQGAFQSIADSIKLVIPHWVSVVLLHVYIMIIFVVTFLPFLLSGMCPYTWARIAGLAASILLSVWTLPYMVMIYGEIYHQLADHASSNQ